MSRNGSGVYSLPAGSIVSTGDTVEPTQHNTPLQDLETDANTARPVVAGGTGATTAGAARTNLGLAIGSDVQAYDAGLVSIAGLTTAADRMIYTTGSDAYAVATLTSFARTLLDDADASTARATLGLGTTSVQTQTIADDAVGSFTPPSTGGFAMVTVERDTSFPRAEFCGLVYFDTGSSLLASNQSTTPVGTNLDTSTSNVTGTTGTDGNVTFAVQSGAIKIENRGGSSLEFEVTFL